MDITHLHFYRDIPVEDRAPFSAYTRDGFGVPETSILAAYELHKTQIFFSPLYHIYLIGKPIKALIETLQAQDAPSEDTLLTIIATSASLYRAGLPEHIEMYLKQQEFLDHTHAQIFKLALHEGILNAIEHGNLNMADVKAMCAKEPDGLTKFHKKVEDKLSDDSFGHKLVSITIALKDGLVSTQIEDCGDGFDYRKTIRDTSLSATDTPQGSGRGIGLMMRSTVHFGFANGGRCLKFSVPALNRPESHRHLSPISTEEIKKNSKILLVDDQDINITQMTEFLTRDNYQNIFVAHNGAEALDQVAKHNPDIILMDIVMPIMDGFEACQRLKMDEETAETPVLFLSGLTDSNNRAQGYKLGAVDYINKPIERDEFLARTLVHLQNGLQRRAMRTYSEHVREELQKARLFQKSLMPSSHDLQHIINKHKTYIDLSLVSCDEVAGDYTSIYDLDSEHIAVVMADFTGHGLGAALHTIWMDATLKELQSIATDPLKLMQELNNNLYHVLSVDQFATCFYGVLNTQTGCMRYISAGAPEVLHFNAQGRIQKSLEAAGLPLGVIPTKELDMTVHEISLKPSDILLFYSDALIETKHRGRGMWDKPYITSIAERALSEGKPLLHGLRKAFYRSAYLPLEDDFSLMTLLWQPPT